MTVSPEELLEPGSIEKAAASIGEKASVLPPVKLPYSEDTVYLTTADRSGMMVSFIQSNFMAFGSGIVIPGTGISMQNRGSGFVLDPAHPNVVDGNKRPYHTIIPGFLTEAGHPKMSFGVMGGYMQHQGHLQMVSRVVDYNQNPQAASDALDGMSRPTIRFYSRMDLVRRWQISFAAEVMIWNLTGGRAPLGELS